MGHSEKHDSGIMWMNGGDTYVDIFQETIGGNSSSGRIVNFLSEAGMLEFFIIAYKSPKRLQK